MSAPEGRAIQDARFLKPAGLHKKAAWLLLPLSLLGCDRTHMHATYGRSVRQAFAAQADVTAPPRRPAQDGLDPEEAAIVLETYRKSLSPMKDAGAAARAPVLLLQAPAPGANVK